MEAPITLWQFLLGVLTIMLPQVYNIYKTNKDAKSNAPLVEAQADEKVFQAWEKLAGEYARQIESLKKLETEDAELRPLVLKMALQEQEMKQVREDKDDWKRYANRLTEQIVELGQVPRAFRRTPSDGDTQDKIKPVVLPAEQQTERAIRNERAASRETPTVADPDRNGAVK